MTKILVLLMLAWSTFAVASLDAPPYQAFLAKVGRWEAHPDAPNLKIGVATVIILKPDGHAIRYTGEVWEYDVAGKKHYELQTHSGFLVGGGLWSERGRDGARIVFNKTSSDRTVTPADPKHQVNGVVLSTSCSAASPMREANEVKCGTVYTTRVLLGSIPESVEAALSRPPAAK